MQTPIISPWLIYLINATFGIKIVMFFAGVTIAVLAYGFYLNQDFRDVWSPSYANRQKARSYKRKKIACIVMAVIFFVASFLIPSKETCYQMLVAHYVTYENADLAGDQAKEMIDYVLDRVDDIANGGKNNE